MQEFTTSCGSLVGSYFTAQGTAPGVLSHLATVSQLAGGWDWSLCTSPPLPRREAEGPVQGHTAGIWDRWNINPGVHLLRPANSGHFNR